MEYRVELTTRAERDLESLYEHIHASDSSAAAHWFNRLEDAIYGLAEMPHRCPEAPESRKAKRQLRHLLFGNKPHVYRVIFQVEERQGRVTILTIRHGAMDVARTEELR